jgi:hypothetical protein
LRNVKHDHAFIDTGVYVKVHKILIIQ